MAIHIPVALKAIQERQVTEIISDTTLLVGLRLFAEREMPKKSCRNSGTAPMSRRRCREAAKSYILTPYFFLPARREPSSHLCMCETWLHELGTDGIRDAFRQDSINVSESFATQHPAHCFFNGSELIGPPSAP